MKIKELYKRMGLVLSAIIGMYLVITKIISPMVEKSTVETKSMLIMVLVIVSIYLYNAVCFAFDLEELRKIVMGKGRFFLLLLLPLYADIVLRDYYAEYQSEVGGNGELPSRNAIIPILLSLPLIVVVLIVLPIIAYREGITYMTRELGLVGMIVFQLFLGLQLMRNLAISKIIRACGDYTYMDKSGKYLWMTMALLLPWVFVFIVSPLLMIIGVNITHPIINLLTTVAPITVLPIYVYTGIRRTRLDMTEEYDMDIY